MRAASDGRDLLATLVPWWLGVAAGAAVASAVAWAWMVPGTRPVDTPYGWIGYLVVTASAAAVGAVLAGGVATAWWRTRTGRPWGRSTALACVLVATVTVGGAVLVGLWTAVPVLVLIAPLVAHPVATSARLRWG